jgi:hypothetical protein
MLLDRVKELFSMSSMPCVYNEGPRLMKKGKAQKKNYFVDGFSEGHLVLTPTYLTFERSKIVKTVIPVSSLSRAAWLPDTSANEKTRGNYYRCYFVVGDERLLKCQRFRVDSEEEAIAWVEAITSVINASSNKSEDEPIVINIEESDMPEATYGIPCKSVRV